MPVLKSLLKRSDVEVAKKRRKDRYSGEPISAGDLCLVVREGQRDRFNYSGKTALKMIQQARLALDELEKKFL